jgi:hypothetical protein
MAQQMPKGEYMENSNSTTNAEVEVITEVVETIPNEIEIEYLGNKEKISLDDKEAIKALLQKGRDYDRIQEKYGTAKTKLSKAEEVARMYNYRDEDGHGNVDEFLETVKQSLDKQQIETLVEGGLSEADAKELLYLRSKQAEFDNYKKEQETKKQKETNQLEFLKYFELVNGRKFTDSDVIPKEVLLDEINGTPLKWAYADYLAKKSAEKSNIEKVNEENKETASQSMESTSTAKSSFTEEEVRAMSREAVQKNFKVIAESMKKWKK